MSRSDKTRVLVVRTVKAELIPSLVQKWKAQFQDVSFDILTHYGQTNVDYYKEKFGNIFIYRAVKDFYIHHLDKNVLKNIRRNKYDVVIFPHRGPNCQGFANVIVMILSMGSKHIAHCGLDGKLEYINKLVVLKLALESFLTAVLFVVMIPVSILFFLFSWLFKNRVY